MTLGGSLMGALDTYLRIALVDKCIKIVNLFIYAYDQHVMPLTLGIVRLSPNKCAAGDRLRW